MSTLRGSLNYAWYEANLLDKGATGAVYQGVNKTTGEPVAVKTFLESKHERSIFVQNREIEVLKKLNHKNIVKLLAIEEENEKEKKKVIIMELYTGGSLFKIINEPENIYGLEQTEFLLVLDHLSAGMKYLRDKEVVHRDLKPGNIMKYISNDGSTVYKLIDFGAARELPDGQEFYSLFGTEEYLYPYMYESGVLRKKTNKTFGATVDLWSIGATLYQLATGNLPFRPYGGRANRKTMFRIITQKISGVISGVQTTDRGPIEWSYKLPQSCQLSGGLKKIVTPLLAGLLEADQQLIWSFDKFFKEVTNILSRKIMHIFFINRVESIEVFILPDEKYEHLENYIKEQTEIQTENQILLYEGSCFSESCGTDTRAEDFPKSNKEKPLCLYSKDNNNIFASLQEIPTFTEFTTNVPIDRQEGKARNICEIGYVCKRRIETLTLKTSLIKQSVREFTQYIKTHLKELHQLSSHLTDITNSYKLAAEMFNHLIKINNEIDYTETCVKVTELYNKNVIKNMLQLEWESASKNVADPKALPRVKVLIERVRDSWLHLVKERVTKCQSPNELESHRLELVKIKNSIHPIKDILLNECQPVYKIMTELLGDWYKIAQTVYLQTCLIKKDVESYRDEVENFGRKFTNCVGIIRAAKSRITEENYEKLKRIAKNIVKEKEENERVRNENFELHEKLNDLIRYISENYNSCED